MPSPTDTYPIIGLELTLELFERTVRYVKCSRTVRQQSLSVRTVQFQKKCVRLNQTYGSGPMMGALFAHVMFSLQVFYYAFSLVEVCFPYHGFELGSHFEPVREQVGFDV